MTMTHAKMAEATINASLDAYLHGARHGDVNQARYLHDMLDKMLTEQESDEGRFWLTDHARMLLADMHRQLSHCEETGSALSEHVLDAVRLKPRTGHWQDSCDFVADLRIALAVANELCQQNKTGCEQDLGLAAGKVADGGEYDLDAGKIMEIYDEVAATVGGFKEMTRC
jgi:hypothetical protein